MPGLPRGQRHPVELRERAVRLVVEHRHEDPSQWKAILSVAEKLNLNRTRPTISPASSSIRPPWAATVACLPAVFGERVRKPWRCRILGCPRERPFDLGLSLEL